MKRLYLSMPATLVSLGLGACDTPIVMAHQAPEDSHVADPQTEVQGTDVAVETVAAVFGSAIWQQGLPEAEINAIASRDGETIYIGTNQGLYRAVGPDFAPEFVPAFSAALQYPLISSIALRDNHEMLVLDGSGVLYESDDDGATWKRGATLPQSESSGRAHLVTNGKAVVFVRGDGPTYLQRDSGLPWSQLTEEAVDLDAFQGLGLDVVAFTDDGALIGNSSGYFAAGVYKIPLDVATVPTEKWSRVAGLDEAWGYQAFAFAGTRAVTSNLRDFFVREEGAWRVSLSLAKPAELGANPAAAFAAVGETFLAAGDDGVRRSVDGAQWELVSPIQVQHTLTAAGSRAFGGADGLRSSDDLGATWREHPGATRTVPNLLAVDGALVAFYGHGDIIVTDGSDSSRQAFAAAPENLVNVDGTLWGLSDAGVLIRNVGISGEGEVVPSDWTPTGHAIRYRRIFSAAGALFVSNGQGYLNEAPSCGLWRRDASTGEWIDASAGLPGVSGCSVAVRHLSSADGLLFAGMETGETFRSDDLGATWAPVAFGVVSGVAACGERMVLTTESGSVWNSTDRGDSFSPLVGPQFADVSSVVGAGGWCVLGRGAFDDGPTLWASHDGATFEPLAADFVAPVVTLAANDEVLGVSTLANGVFRIPVTQP